MLVFGAAPGESQGATEGRQSSDHLLLAISGLPKPFTSFALVQEALSKTRKNPQENTEKASIGSLGGQRRRFKDYRFPTWEFGGMLSERSLRAAIVRLY